MIDRYCTHPDSVSPNGPWTFAGRWLERWPWVFIAFGFWLFWIFRSQVFAGDGDQLARMIEAGLWLVQTELLSQAILQLTYQILRPFGWDGLAVTNLISCIAGAAALWALLLFNRRCVGADPIWAVGLFFSSGLVILCAGHTEYYTLFLVTLLYYGYAGVHYLRGQMSLMHVSLAFSLAMWMHMGILFALPSLLMLPLLTRRSNADLSHQYLSHQYKAIAWGLLPAAAAFFFKEFHYVFGIVIQGLSPTTNFVPLFDDPTGERFYAMLQWGHLLDIAWMWSRRSWIFWPMILACATIFGLRSLLRTDRLFLLAYLLCFSVFTVIWHPNLGVIEDWDLFSIEAVPALLLCMTYLPEWLSCSYRRVALALPLAASIFIMWDHIIERADFTRRGYGTASIELAIPVQKNLNFNGHQKREDEVSIRQGVHAIKLIDLNHRKSHDVYAAVVPGLNTIVFIDNRPQEE